MIEIPARELRNDVSAVLRRVSAGEAMVITVSGRPVARLTPLARRPDTVPALVLFAAVDRVAADSNLTAELADAFPDTTDDVV